MDRAAKNLYKSHMISGLIPTYNLFGESDDLPDVIHCETIEARSRLHDWEFAPHRHARLHQVLLLEDGAGRASLEGQDYALTAGTLVNVPRNIVHGYRFVPETRGLVVTLASELLEEMLRPGEGVLQALSCTDSFATTPDISATLKQIAAAHQSRGFARAQILRGLSGLLLGQIAHQLSNSYPLGPGRRAPELLRRFETLLDRHYRAHWPVARYAAELAITPAHLSRITRKAFGRPASALIEDRLIREARRNLVFTNLPVSTIAYALGFEDPAYFSRVFKRATGHAPRAFRDHSQT